MATITLKITAEDKHLVELVTLLKHMEYLGNVGASRALEVLVDGDGAFQCKVDNVDKVPLSLKHDFNKQTPDDQTYVFD